MRWKLLAARVPGAMLSIRIVGLLRNPARFRSALVAGLYALLGWFAGFVGLQRQFDNLASWWQRREDDAARLHLDRVGRREEIGSVGTSPPAILIDIRIAQIHRRERGIPRYSLALALSLPAALPPGGEVMYLIDPDHRLPDFFDRLRSRGRIVRGCGEIVDLPRVTHYLQSCVFEFHKDVGVLFPAELARFQPRLCAIAYDLIPWLYKEHYLRNPYLLRRYRYQSRFFDHLDRLLAISECTAQDFVRFRNLEPARVIPVYGGIDLSRFPSLRTLAERHERGEAEVPTRHDLALPSVAGADGYVSVTDGEGRVHRLRQPYWLYVGGDDFRKNVAGLIRGFARTRAANLSPPPALVIACKLPAGMTSNYLQLAHSLGLKPGEEVVFTGYIPDAELEICYRGAFGTVFPSLYEGLGLPILEGYHFGVPAISSNNSSLQELTAHECQFDVSSEAAMAELMVAMHQDPALRERSLTFGDDVLVRLCNWKAVARRVAGYMTAG
jgi:glycosyltransferase involved in cell wall biosynthesis